MQFIIILLTCTIEEVDIDLVAAPVVWHAGAAAAGPGSPPVLVLPVAAVHPAPAPAQLAPTHPPTLLGQPWTSDREDGGQYHLINNKEYKTHNLNC